VLVVFPLLLLLDEVTPKTLAVSNSPGTTSPSLHRLGERHYLVGARITLNRFKEVLILKIPRCDDETLAGFMLHQAQAVPRPGTMIRQGDITFTVERGTHEALREIRIRW